MNVLAVSYEYLSVCVFKVGEFYFGIDQDKIIKTFDNDELKGLFNKYGLNRKTIKVFGKEVPIYDLNVILRNRKTRLRDNTSIIICNVETKSKINQIGLLIDSVSEIYKLKETDIVSTRLLPRKYQKKYITGMINNINYFIKVLDLEEFIMELIKKEKPEMQII